MPEDTNHRHFRVPRDDRSLFALPPFEMAAGLVAGNQTRFATANCSLHGRTLADLRTSTRRQAVELALAYTTSLLQVEVPSVLTDSLVVSGHQPELFHVGVWAKNFAMAAVARQSCSVAVNLVIDNDTLNETSLRIPAGSRERLRVERMPFDAPQATQPWEEAIIRDRTTFEQFGSVVRKQIHDTWGFEPLIGSYWDSAIRQSRISNRLCDGLTAMRANVERKWGLHNLELPMSRLCETDSFRWFAAHLLIRASEVYRVYNEAVAEYRQSHRIRNRMQPVPDLERDGDWFESPFWIWKQGDIQRGRLFARQSGSDCELRDEKNVVARLRLTDHGTLDEAVNALREMSARGFRLRTRALTTTLFARVFLADLFVHGIGGAKYDEMTNQLCQRLFDLDAPEYLTVSATLYLPLGGAYGATDIQLRAINSQLRDLNYNPERHLMTSPEIAALVSRKSEILAEAKLLRATNQMHGRLNPAQHRKLNDIRESLLAQTKPIRSAYESTRMALQSQLASNALIRNREYSFALYPEELVRQFLNPLATALQGEGIT